MAWLAVNKDGTETISPEKPTRDWYRVLSYSRNYILKKAKGRKTKQDRTYEDFYKFLAKSPELGKVEPLNHFLKKYHDSSK